MSTAAAELGRELAEEVEQEAARAESEPDDETQEGEEETTPAEPEPESEPAEPMSQKEIEAAQRKLDAENERHAKRVREIMGAEFDALGPCPLCDVAGFVFPFVGQRTDPAQRTAVLALFGEEAEPELRQDPTTVTCATCDGWGEVLSGGKSATNRKKTCPTCMGSGYGTRTDQPPPGQSVTTPPYSGDQAATFTPPGAPPPPTPVYDYATGTWKLPGT